MLSYAIYVCVYLPFLAAEHGGVADDASPKCGDVPRQVDVTSKTEGAAFADATGVPLLVKYDARLRENVAKGIVEEVNTSVQACRCTVFLQYTRQPHNIKDSC